MSDTARLDSGRTFLQSAAGRWASERMLKALKEHRRMSPAELRTNDTLQRDEWKFFDDAVIDEAVLRLRGILDLESAPGLVISVPNAMGKTLFEWEKTSDMEEAILSMDGVARSDDDRVEFEPENTPLPIAHKDFNIKLRQLEASRERGESLDDIQVRTATRKVAEKLESVLFNGGPQFGGAKIYGYTTHPDRVTGSFGTNGNWSQAAKTGENRLADLITMKRGLIANGFSGPFWVYGPTDYSVGLDEDFKANSDKTIRQRLLETDEIERIEFSDQFVGDGLIMVQASRDTVALLDGEDIQAVQWDIYGGFAVAMKVFAIKIPLLRSTKAGKMGLYHMS